MTTRALFTGSRRWSDEAAVARVVDALPADAVVIHGGADGLDSIVDRLARGRGLLVIARPADWEVEGREAGKIRNERMLAEEHPTEGHAFPLLESRGTWHMVRLLRGAGIPCGIYGADGPEERALALAVVDERVIGLRSFDSETHRFRAGDMAPRIVCASTARLGADGTDTELLVGPNESLRALREMLEPARSNDAPCACPVGRDMGGRPCVHHAAACRRRPPILAFANAAYDLAVAAAADPSLLPAIFKALRQGRIHDVLLAQGLDAIYHGHHGELPDGRGALVNPETGQVSKRYSLALCAMLVLGRPGAKRHDAWKESYALLDGIPAERWPDVARVYPLDDAVNTAEVAALQIVGRPGEHEWSEVPPLPGSSPTSLLLCSKCFKRQGDATEHCGEPVPHQNLGNLPAQVAADFALELGAAWSLRADPERVAKLSAEVDEKHRVAVARYQQKGWIRSGTHQWNGLHCVRCGTTDKRAPCPTASDHGTEDQAAVKRAIVIAYGGQALCQRCAGTGKIRPTKWESCRGEKVRGRYRGCVAPAGCATCGDSGMVAKLGNEITCKNVEDDHGNVIEEGCDGSGFDLSTLPLLPRADKMGVKTDRDTKMESGDEDLSDYGEDEFNKSRDVYVPYLWTGTRGPMYISSNCLVATGRCSYENCPFHQFPRFGGERECVRARGAWCDCPYECVLGSTDYEAGELCCLAQFCKWKFGYSNMLDAINASGKPGILHSDLAAQVLGISLPDFLVRLKAKDKQAVDFRQAAKPYQFGRPAGMGAAKIVLTNRKKSVGFTECEEGPALHKGKRGYWGARFCILLKGAKRCGIEKVTEWKKRPCAPVCKACAEAVQYILGPAYAKRYPEVTKDYHRWVTKAVKRGERAPSLVWSEEEQKPVIERERGGCDFSAFANNAFQSMLARIGKAAYFTATEECYTGYKLDGTPSPLAGCHLPLFMHDEPLSELLRATAHRSGPRLADIMMEEGRKVAPDVTWRAETALAFWWSKSMEPVYADGFDVDGTPLKNMLVPWGPTPS